MKRILVIAGSDSSGGAGLEADQKVIAAHGCYAMTATTALTAQNTEGVYGIHEIPADFVAKQIDACISDIGVDVVKTGMLTSADTIKTVSSSLRKHNVAVSVIDPVMVSTSGSQLLPENAVKSLLQDLMPITTLLTPNISEAQLLLKESGQKEVILKDAQNLEELARAIHNLGPKNVLVKGGHLPLTKDGKVAKTPEECHHVVNALFDGRQVHLVTAPYSSSKNTHGTGCSLASAIACNLATDLDMAQAVSRACKYVSAGIETSISLGKGAGPLNHFHSVQRLPFYPGGFIEYLLDREDVKPAWHAYTHHEFTTRMGDGTLPQETFKYYMIQDYLYLIQFARANALAGYKAKKLDDIASAAQIVTHINKEIGLHIGECAEFGLTVQDMEAYEESQACTAYTRYMLDIGQSEDWIALQIVILPCLLGYGVVAKRLHEQQLSNPPEQPNRYLKWIQNYVADDYAAAVKTGCALIEKHIVDQSPKRIEELVKIFVHATKMEAGFWDMAGTA